MPLSQKDLKTMKSSLSKIDMRIDMNTIEAFSEFEENESLQDEEENKIEEDISEKKLKYLNPLEIKEHMKRLWEVEDTLLSPIFCDWSIFFLNNILVSPNRFRPESSGGKSAGDDREFLHAHSAMLTRILKSNQSLRKCIEHKENIVSETRSESERSRAHSTEIDRKEYTSKDVIRHWIDLQDAIN